jgi:hypothetical protein
MHSKNYFLFAEINKWQTTSAVVCCKTATRGLNQIAADCRKCCFGNSCWTQANTLLGIFAAAVSQKCVNVTSAKVCKPGEGQPTVAVIFHPCYLASSSVPCRSVSITFFTEECSEKKKFCIAPKNA